MGENSKIEWTHHTMNPWRGCTRVSAGCTHCYAETMSRRNPAVLGAWGNTGSRVVASESKWHEPLRWDKAAAKAGERHRVFCASLADVFEDWRGSMVDAKGNVLWWRDGQIIGAGATSVNLSQGERVATMDDVRRRLARLIRKTPHLDWLLLTKRPENANTMTYAMWFPDAAWPKNRWMGVTVEDRKSGVPRIAVLRETLAPVKFLSCEPLLEDLGTLDLTGIDLVIVGGESGPGARPMHPRWARSIRDQCVKSKVAYFFKQWGEWAPVGDDTPRGAKLAYVHLRGGHELAISGYEPGCPCDSMPSDEPMVRVGKHRAGRLLDGRTWDEFPKPKEPAHV